MARWVVRAYMEAERGLRDPRVLRPFLAPHLYFGLEERRRTAGDAPVSGGDIGGAQFSRLGTGKGYAVVVVRDSVGRWHAVMLVFLRAASRAWHVVAMQTLDESIGRDGGPPGSGGAGGVEEVEGVMP